MSEILKQLDISLSGCFKLLQQQNDYKEEELLEALPKIVSSAETYVYNLDPNDEDLTKAMKTNCETFFRKIQDSIQKNKQIKNHVKELQSLWKIANLFYYGCEDPDTHSAKKKDFFKWFNKNRSLLFTSEPSTEDIEVVLKVAGITTTLAKTLSNFVMETINMLKDNAESTDVYSKWKKKAYTYDDESKCCVVFYNEKYYVDHYGNFYLNEDTYFQFFRRINGHVEYKSQDGKTMYVQLNTDDVFLQELLTAFKSVNKKPTFSNFVKDTSKAETDAVDALIQLKAFSCFFCQLESFTERNKGIRIFFGVEQKNIQMCFYDFKMEEICTKNFLKTYDSFITLLEKMKEHQDALTSTPYGRTVKRIIKKAEQYKTALQLKASFIKNFINAESSYVDICFEIAEKMVNHILSVTEYKDVILKNELQPDQFAYILYYVAEKYEDESEAIVKFISKEQQVYDDYCKLMMAVVTCEKPEDHRYINDFAGAYNFAKHYTPIRNVMQEKTRKKKLFPQDKPMPQFTSRNLEKCAVYYFKYLPEYIFKGDYTTKVEQLGNQDIKKYLYYFKKEPLIGVKWKIVISNAPMPPMFGNTDTDSGELENALIQQEQQQQTANSNHQHQVQQQQPDDVDDIINYLPPNFRRVTEIYVDTTTEQHYISATSPGGTTGLIPIQLQATSVDGPPQPISVSTFSQQQHQNRQQNGL